MLVGFGLRDCLRDILEGKVAQEEVSYIFRGGVNTVPSDKVVTTREEFYDYVKNVVSTFFWDDKAVQLAMDFWDQGKILYSNGLLPDYRKTWFDVDDEIPCKFRGRNMKSI
jgi:hypothetical protein